MVLYGAIPSISLLFIPVRRLQIAAPFLPGLPISAP
jgi:hypothetical protein